MPTKSRFAGLRLDDEDRARLKKLQAGGTQMSVRWWRRLRTLLLLDLGYTVSATAEAVGTYRRETARVGKRYLAGGLEHDDPRPKPDSMLDSAQEAAIVAMVCGPHPRGEHAGRCACWRRRRSHEESHRNWGGRLPGSY
jgi:hypothetical protein